MKTTSKTAADSTALRKKRYKDRYLSLPAIIWVAIVTQIPFAATVVISTLKWNLKRPDQGVQFDWLNNYAYYFWGSGSSDFWKIFFQTIELVLIALLGCTLLGFLLALLLDNKFPGVNIVRTLLLGPFFVMSTTSAVVWKTTILNMTFGWYGHIAKLLGGKAIDLITFYPLQTVAILFIWQWMPFFMLVILSGLQSISEEVLESASLDGANWFQMTFRIKLPMITSYMEVALMLGLLFLVKEFGLIWIIGGNNKNAYSLSYYIYEIVFSAQRPGRAAAVSVVMVALVTVMVNLLYKSIRRRSANGL